MLLIARENKNHDQRVIQSFGPKFRIDVNGTLMGQKGTNVYLLYAVTDDNSTQFQALSESRRGLHRGEHRGAHKQPFNKGNENTQRSMQENAENRSETHGDTHREVHTK